ncbi:MAG TPA: archaeal heat shock protein Hsp20 [Nitrososphaeraceae archaeon]
MSFPSDLDPYNFLRNLFAGGGTRVRREGKGFGSGGWNFDDMFREFDEMRKETERAFSEQFKNIENKVPKDLIKEYETPEGGKVRQVGPIVYGYSMTIGADGKPKIRQFGNVKSPIGGMGSFEQPSISAEREPLIDISSTDNEVKIVAEMPGISKDKIKVNVYDKYVEIKSEDPNRKYHKKIEIPEDIDINSAKSNYNNGVLEINFKKKEQRKPQGRQINVE